MNSLWRKWKEHYTATCLDANQITRDGIINPGKYLKEKKKLLFVLKDSNVFPGGDLAKYLMDGPRGQTWHTLARWAAGILTGFKQPYESIDNYKVMSDSMQKIAAINLKKYTGKSVADMSAVNAFAYHDRELLRDQIQEITPNMIIACGVYEPLIWLLDIKLDPREPYKTAGTYKDKVPVIPWMHPGRKDNKKTYLELTELLRDQMDVTS